MKKIIFILSLSISFFSCNSSKSELQYLNELFEQAEYREIIKLYFEKKDDYEKDSQLINKTGQAFHQLKKYQNAIECFDNAIKLNANVSVLYSNKGLAEIELGKYVSAAISCEKAIELDSESFLGYTNRSYAFIKLKKWELALEDLKKAISIKGIEKKEMGFAYANLGTVYINKGENEKALECSNRAIELNDQLPWAYKNRAYLKMSKQDVKAALLDIKEGLQLSPNDVTLIYYKGLISFKSGKEKEGCELILKSIELIPNSDYEKYKIILNSGEKYCK